jgi:hypothetical protein
VHASGVKTTLLALGLSLSLLACGDDGGGAGGGGGEGGAAPRAQGEPCTEDAQCAEGLTCDLAHEEATCEVPHSDATPQSSSSGGDGGAGGGAGGGDPASDCELLCSCLEATCSSLEGYPYADTAACLTNCEAHTAEEVTCWGQFCDQAATSADPDHLCEHAWGDLGLEEC